MWAAGAPGELRELSRARYGFLRTSLGEQP